MYSMWRGWLKWRRNTGYSSIVTSRTSHNITSQEIWRKENNAETYIKFKVKGSVGRWPRAQDRSPDRAWDKFNVYAKPMQLNKRKKVHFFKWIALFAFLWWLIYGLFLEFLPLYSIWCKWKVFGESLETFTNYSPFCKILSRTPFPLPTLFCHFLLLGNVQMKFQKHKIPFLNVILLFKQ